MRTPLPVGTHLTISAIGTQQQITVQIQELIGTGASCLVYTAVCRDGEQNEFYLRLKEFCPENLHLIRQQDGSLLAADEEAFQRQMQSFIWGYQKQMQFRQFPESCNSISNVQGVFAGNGTRYIAMNCQNSIPLEQQELSLYDTFRVLRAVAQQLDNLHQHGYLYLDLKPANVLLYPETPELVMLFDFDSAIEKSRLSDAVISCTAKWAAPEVLQQNRRKIGVVSDVYKLGGLLLGCGVSGLGACRNCSRNQTHGHGAAAKDLGCQSGKAVCLLCGTSDTDRTFSGFISTAKALSANQTALG